MRTKKLLMQEFVRDIKEGAILFDGLARLVVGITATCHYTVDGKFHLGPYSGVYASRKAMHQGKPKSNNDIPLKDREYIQMGIFNDEQRQRYELTGDVISWCDTAEGKRILKDTAVKKQLEALLRQYARVGAAYGAMGVAAAPPHRPSSLFPATGPPNAKRGKSRSPQLLVLEGGRERGREGGRNLQLQN